MKSSSILTAAFGALIAMAGCTSVFAAEPPAGPATAPSVATAAVADAASTESPGASACPPSATDVLPKSGWESAARRATDRGLLWRVEKDGRTSWLYGTIHIARFDWVMPGPTVKAALQQSDTIALEINLLDAEAMKGALASRQAEPAAKEKLLSGERGQRMARQMALACATDELQARLNRVQPILQAIALTMLAGRADGFYAEFGIDIFLSAFGRGANKPVVALETVADQMKLLGANGGSREAEQVDQMLDQLESGNARRQLRELAEAWARGDRDKLANYGDWCNCLQSAAAQRQWKRLVDDRNPGIADGIERLHASGKRVFGAVGALHMVGPHGLPGLLAQRGFTVTAVLPVGEAKAAATATP